LGSVAASASSFPPCHHFFFTPARCHVNDSSGPNPPPRPFLIRGSLGVDLFW
jgi:hypothetical protein